MQLIEQLETRRLFASFTASSVAELIADINAANALGGSNTITLKAKTTFKLTAVDNDSHGATGLPVVAAGNDLTINGDADFIERSTARATPAFRLFDVAAGGSLTLSGLTLSNGLSLASVNSSPLGGAVRSEGTLSLNGVTIQNSIVKGAVGVDYAPDGQMAVGGGIYSSGVLTVANSTIRNNLAQGGAGLEVSMFHPAGTGGQALGGGLYVAGGTVTVINTTFSSNLASGGDGGPGAKLEGGFFPGWAPGGRGGNAYGGAVYAQAGTVTFRGTTISQNEAKAGLAGSFHKGAWIIPTNGVGQGGGIYVAPGASASLDSFTQTETSGNSASTSDNDIFGSFTIL
jgi:hypothetical protein